MKLELQAARMMTGSRITILKRASSTPSTLVLDPPRRNDWVQRPQTGSAPRADLAPVPKSWSIDHRLLIGLHPQEEVKGDAIHIRRVVLNEVPVVRLPQGPDRVPLTTPFALQVHLLPMLMKLVLALEATLGLVLQFTLQSVDEGHCQEPSRRLIQVDATLDLHLDNAAHPHEVARRLVVLGLLLDFAYMGLQGALRTDEIRTGLYALRLRVVAVEATDDLRPVIPGLKERGNVGIAIRRGEIQIGRKTSVVVSVERVVMRLVPDGESAMVKLARNTVAAVVVVVVAPAPAVPIMGLAMAAIPARR